MTGQTYANHAHRPIAWNVAFAGATVAFVMLLVDAWFDFTSTSFALALLGGVVMLGVALTRTFALRLQNRIIRLEMQVRLARLGRAADFDRLSLRQLIALRFASDAEMPALIDRALAEKLDGRQIKEAVKDWQGDYLRT
jgi:nitrate/nitrite transporter NarK